MNKRYKIILYLFLIINTIMLLFSKYNNSITVIIFTILTIYSIFKNKNNKYLFFLFLILAYFNLSVIVTKYSLFYNSNILSGLFLQLRHSESMNIALLGMTIFLNILVIFCDSIKQPNEIKQNNIKYNVTMAKILVIIIGLVKIFLIYNFLKSGNNYVSQAYEYYIIFLIIGLYLSKNDKLLSKYLQIIILFSCISTLIFGSRITALEEILAIFVVNYLDKFKIKTIVIIIVSGVLLFSVIGIYGDLKYSTTIGLNHLSSEYVIDSMAQRKFALDTSVSSYWSGLSMIDNMDRFTNKDRIKNFIDFLTIYLVKGSGSNYKDPSMISLHYQVNYGGGFITSYFYFWLGIIGVYLIGLYVSFLIKKSCEINSNYSNLIKIYILAIIPRWYLYTPSMLFRGLLLFSICYFIIFKLFLRSKSNG